MKTIAAIITFCCATALGSSPTQNPEHWFRNTDFNKDQKVSLKEFANYMTEYANARGKNLTMDSIKLRFNKLDRNKDGAIVLDELFPEKTTSTEADPSVSRGDTTSGSLAGYRDFKAANGTCSTYGKIIAFDSCRNMVTIEKKGIRKPCKVNAELLSEEDQIYIREWECAKRFNSESRFKISAKRKPFKSESKRHINEYFGTESKKITIEDIGYEITLENHTGCPFNKVVIEYCIYYEQERAERGKQVTDEGVLRGTLKVGSMGPRAERTLITEPVTLFKRELNADWDYYSGAQNTQKGEVIGIWVQVQLHLSELITRHFCLPDSLKDNRNWYHYDVPVGMNRK